MDAEGCRRYRMFRAVAQLAESIRQNYATTTAPKIRACLDSSGASWTPVIVHVLVRTRRLRSAVARSSQLIA